MMGLSQKAFAAFAGLLTLSDCLGTRPRASSAQLSPSNGQQNVNPDTHLVLTFATAPSIGKSGNISVYDTESNKLVDTLDLSIPSSPSPYGNGSTKANYSDTTIYQTNIIGGMDFYFFPIIVRDNVATIYLHNNRLEYNKTYAVFIESGVLTTSDGTFNGISNSSWTFTTKSSGPPKGKTQVTVAADGSADFNTVQGAIDWAPINPTQQTKILIKNGNYEELVYFQYKSNLVIRGESRNKTLLGYPNNSAFNPPNRQGPSRRPAFSFKGVTDVQLSDFSITNYYRGQAESLLIDGSRVVVSRLNLNGSGDALTTYGTSYISDTVLYGDGDTVLGYGSVFWKDSTIITTAGALTWTRTGQAQRHGNIFVDCTLIGEQGNSTFARLPDNTGGVLPNWPYAEMVLINTKTEGVDPVGWGPVQGAGFDSSHVHFWEYNTTDRQGQKVDLSQRLNISRQLTIPADKDVLEQYADPSFVLGGWSPIVY